MSTATTTVVIARSVSDEAIQCGLAMTLDCRAMLAMTKQEQVRHAELDLASRAATAAFKISGPRIKSGVTI